MASEAQIAVNRANAQQSTGPRTEAVLPVTPTEHFLVPQLAALKEEFVVDTDTDSRDTFAFEKRTQSSRALEILSLEIDRLPTKPARPSRCWSNSAKSPRRTSRN